MSGTPMSEFPNPEQLIAKFYRKRASALVFYIFGFIIFILGWLFMIMSSIQFVAFTLIAWYIGIGAMTTGIVSILWAELWRKYTLYIITSWTIRTRKGYFRQRTKRVFLDEIKSVNILVDEEERIVNQGDVEVIGEESDDALLVMTGVDNPRGVREIILRLVQTIPQPIPWAHIERTRDIMY